MKNITDYILEKNISVNTEANAFTILKPGFLSHKKEFYDMLNSNGWQIVKSKKQTLPLKTAQELYSCHKDKDFYNDLCNYMNSGDCICCSCYKDCKDPISDMKSVKNKFRDKFGIDDMKNGMHSSDSLENVGRETEIIFNAGEIQ